MERLSVFVMPFLTKQKQCLYCTPVHQRCTGFSRHAFLVCPYETAFIPHTSVCFFRRKCMTMYFALQSSSKQRLFLRNFFLLPRLSLGIRKKSPHCCRADTLHCNLKFRSPLWLQMLSCFLHQTLSTLYLFSVPHRIRKAVLYQQNEVQYAALLRQFNSIPEIFKRKK